jgi:hypothetical protein
VQLTGHFVNQEPTRLFGTTSASGDTVSFVVGRNGQIVAYQVSGHQMPLRKLGAVRTLSVMHYTAASSVAAQLDQIAVNTASWAGDPNISSVTWAPSTWGGASTSLQESSPGTSGAADPVYVMEITGNFQLNVPTSPRDTTEPTCSAVVFMVFQDDFQNAGHSCLASSTDLSVLGSTETDSTVGISPTG